MTTALAEEDRMDKATALLSLRGSGQDHSNTNTNTNSNFDVQSAKLVNNIAGTNQNNGPTNPIELVDTPQAAGQPQQNGAAKSSMEDASAYKNDSYNNNNNNTYRSSLIHFEELPRNADEARVQLEILFALDEWNETGDLDHVVETLTMFPSLAPEMFANRHGYVWLPLVHVMRARADLETVQEVYQLYPEALTVASTPDQNLPLHLACGMDQYDDVTDFMARMYPRALTLYNGAGLLPLHRLMAKKRLARAAEPATFAMIRTLVDIYPASVGIPSLAGVTPLDYAFHEGYDVFVLNYFLNRLPPLMPQFTVNPAQHGKPVMIDLNKARALENLMPHFQCIHCEPASWTTEAMLYMLHTLQTNPDNTNQFRLKLPPALTSDCRFALKQSMELNSNMLQLALTCDEQELNTDNSQTLQALREGLAKSRGNLRMLQLLQFQGRMLELITNPTHLEIVELSQVAFTDDPKLWIPRKDLLSKSHMQRLALSACTIAPECLLKLLNNLVYLPNLMQLSVEVTGPDPKQMLDSNNYNEDNSSGNDSSGNDSRIDVTKQFDMTAPIVEILKNNKLRSLVVGSYPELDMTPSLSETLQHNNTLQVFVASSLTNEHVLADVMRRHNTTLFQLKSANTQINYYATLNACGRTKARDVKITRKQYVELLEAVAMVNVIDDERKHLIQYGLLRESPNQWCNARSERRRSSTHTVTASRASSPDSLCGKRKM